MVYCTKCGTKNADDATVCTQCGASLYGVGERRKTHRVEDDCWGSRKYDEADRMNYECFGIPKGGIIFGLAVGVIIVLAGMLLLLQQLKLIPTAVEVWPFAAIVIGVLILVGALYRLSRR